MNYKKIIRFVLGVALLLFLFSHLNISSLISTLKNIDSLLYLTALLICTIANLLCSLRWKNLSKSIKLKAPKKIFTLVYFEAIAVNCILPGGILGGDVWRTARIVNENKKYNMPNIDTSKKNLLKMSGLCVLVDRIHGFWSLCLIGITSFLVITLTPIEKSDVINNQLTEGNFNQILIYILILILIFLSPVLMRFLTLIVSESFSKFKVYKVNFETEIKSLWIACFDKSTIFISVLSQVLFGLGFWICLNSVDADVNVFLIFLVVPGIFLLGSLPISIAGFGPREAGSLFFLLPLFITNEQIFISSILFGLTSTILGAITLLVSLLIGIKKQ